MCGYLQHPATETALRTLRSANDLYHRLVLVVGTSETGKTPLLVSVAKVLHVPCINVNLELSQLLLDLSARQRMLRLPELMAGLLADTECVVLDNTEMLFDRTLHQDPLRLLQGLSRNCTIIASWTGEIIESKLSYATPEHPEYRQYPMHDLLILDMQVPSLPEGRP